MTVNRPRTDAAGMTGGSPGRRALVVLLSLALATGTPIIGLSLVSADTSQTPNDVGHGILGFEAKRSIAIHNNGTPLEHARVPVVFDTAQEVADGDLEPDCSDLRFTPAETPHLSLSYWLDPATCGDSDTTIWIQVPSIPANEAGPEAQVTMFYGEPGMPAGPLDHVPERRSTGPTVNVDSERSLLASSDTDGDGVTDTLEETLCGRPVEQDLIVDTTTGTGTCESSSPPNYTPTSDETWLISPSLVHAGKDRDGDGIPATVNVSYTNVTLNMTETDPVDVRFGGTVQQILDFNDTNANVPAEDYECSLLDVPRGTTAFFPGPDEDDDGYAKFVPVARGNVCSETGQPHPTTDGSVHAVGADLDPDDEDASVPTATQVTSEPVAKNTSFSPDFDDDRLPCRGFVGFVDITFDRETHDYATDTWTQSISYDADADCTDPDKPTRKPHVDFDGDGIPVRTELYICERQLETTALDGYCTDLDTNYHPPDTYHWSVPRDQGLLVS